MDKVATEPYQEKILYILPDPQDEAFDVMAAMTVNMLLSMNDVSIVLFVERIKHYTEENKNQVN